MSADSIACRLLAYCVVLGAISLRPVSAQPGSPLPDETHAASDQQEIRIATSEDGVVFKDTGVVAVSGGSSPGLVQLPDGQLLLVFDAQTSSKRSTMMAARSKDGGRSWSEPQPIRITSRSPLTNFTGGELLAATDGVTRLYFTLGGGRRREGSDAPWPVVLCAATRDGVNYRLDQSVSIQAEDCNDPHLVLLNTPEETHVFVIDEQNQVNRHYISHQGRDFRPADPPADELKHMRSLVAIDQGYRAYLCTEQGVTSMLSKDLVTWTAEPGVRLEGHWDPAVVRLSENGKSAGGFVMAYAPPLGRKARDAAAPEQTLDSPQNPPAEVLEMRSASAKRIASVGRACLIYAEQHRGALPPNLQTLVNDGFLTERSLISPLEMNSDQLSYVYIDGQRHTMDPRNVVAYEKLENHGGEGTVVLFLDGHSKWMRPEDFERVLEETLERLGQ